MTSTARSCQASAVLRLALLTAGLLALQPALAKRSDRDKPADIVAKSFDGSQQDNGYIIYKGQVRITQGTLQATGDLAKAYLDGDNNVTRVVLTGSPAHIQQLDDAGNLMEGNAATIDYDNVKGIAVLTGNAMVKQQGRGEAHGDKLTYDTGTSQMTGESRGDGLVHMIFKPKPRPAGSAPASRPAASGTAPAPAASAPAPAPATSAGQP
ncbi:lipopolysaccharide transport periplasmic protein LptA [Fulvimonas yonginensis]|uniref:Lipopolysaccharide transport periplasmic protein LptA n=1 Tax=Fulvimonas yonginensis TaxID=1495200 RepID=A0ABU8J978_9GAMM